MKTVVKEVDLSELKKYIGVWIPGTSLELAIIRFYRKNVTSEQDMFKDLNKYITNKLRGTKDVEYTYADLMDLVHEKHYNNLLFIFLGKLEKVLLNNTTPDVIDIVYLRAVDVTNFKFEFEYTYKD